MTEGNVSVDVSLSLSLHDESHVKRFFRVLNFNSGYSVFKCCCHQSKPCCCKKKKKRCLEMNDVLLLFFFFTCQYATDSLLILIYHSCSTFVINRKFIVVCECVQCYEVEMLRVRVHSPDTDLTIFTTCQNLLS